MKITCPRCQATLKVVAAEPGAVHTCPKCQSQFRTGAAPATPANRDSQPSSPNSSSGSSFDDWFDAPLAPALKPAQPSQIAPPAGSASTTKASNSGKTAEAASSGKTASQAKTPSSAKEPPPQPPASPPKNPVTASSTTTPATTNSSVRPPPVPKQWPSAAEGRPELPPIMLDDLEEEGTGRDLPAKRAAQGGELEPPADEQILDLARETGEYRFGVACPVCATRMDFVSSQIGQQASCPDCFTTFEIVTPGPHTERMLVSEDGFGAPDRLSLEAPREDSRRLDSPDVLKQRADQLLQRAAEEMRAQRRETNETVLSDSATHSLFHFLMAPTTWVRLIVVTVLGIPALATLSLATQVEANGSSNFGKLLYLVIGFPLAAIWFLVFAAHLLALLRATSATIGDVEEWPGANVFEWMGSGLQLGWALALAALPGFALVFLAAFLGLGGWVLGLVTPFSVIAFFPIVLLSMLHEQSWSSVFSPEIWRGMTRVSHVATTFYQASTLLGILVWMDLWLLWMGNPLLALPQSVVLAVLGFLYFRLLGWLANSISLEDDEQIVA